MSKIETYLNLQAELAVYSNAMAQAGDIIREQDVSKYPIMVIHQNEVEIGIPIVEKEKQGGNWNINASTLEEFVTKNIVFNEKVEEFIQNYKNPDIHICMFILSELGANFIYLPR
jgi:putative methionine-R-sulfoxide reductase with GAF domain